MGATALGRARRCSRIADDETRRELDVERLEALTLQLIRLSTQALLSRVGGQIVSGPTRINMAKLPGYCVDTTAAIGTTVVEDRLVFAFRGRMEYFLNCQNTKDGPLSGSIKSGCDQVMQTFQLVR